LLGFQFLVRDGRSYFVICDGEWGHRKDAVKREGKKKKEEQKRKRKMAA